MLINAYITVNQSTSSSLSLMDNATLDTIGAMHLQEGAYAVRDFLVTTSSITASSPHGGAPVDAACRLKMLAWCFQIADFCKFNRETVQYAANYLDRFCMAEPDVLQDRNLYQLSSMTSFYTAIKLHECEVMGLSTLSHLSRGAYTGRDFEIMEVRVLSVLQWRMNPPTSMSFVRECLELIPISAHIREAAADLAQFQTELAVTDYAFSTVRPSMIGYCSLVNALESMNANAELVLQIHQSLEQVLQLGGGDVSTRDIRKKLHRAIDDPVISMRVADPAKVSNSAIHLSPRSIATALS